MARNNARQQPQQAQPPPQQQQQQQFNPQHVWKTIITVVSGVTAIIVLVISINSILQPYYAMQEEVEEIKDSIHEQVAEMKEHLKTTKKIEIDSSIMARVIHLLLFNATEDDISRTELLEVLRYFEENVVYNTADGEVQPYPSTTHGTNAPIDGSAQQAIQKITQETLDALAKLK